ncbi:MAG: hypothetical protein ABI995_16735 [Acidobacteriota bacterium]
MQHTKQIQRSKMDWTLEAIALAALLGAIGLLLHYYPQIPHPIVRPDFRYAPQPGVMGLMTAKNALWVVSALNLAAYLGLTFGSLSRGLIHIPEHIERESPYLPQMMFSVVIVMKAVLMMFSIYIVWALINIGLRQPNGLSGRELTLFTLAVPLPLIYYTVKLRRYRR